MQCGLANPFCPPCVFKCAEKRTRHSDAKTSSDPEPVLCLQFSFSLNCLTARAKTRGELFLHDNTVHSSDFFGVKFLHCAIGLSCDILHASCAQLRVEHALQHVRRTAEIIIVPQSNRFVWTQRRLTNLHVMLHVRSGGASHVSWP